MVNGGPSRAGPEVYTFADLTRAAPSCNVHMHTMSGARVPRPRKHRRCHRFDGDRVFKPRSIPMTELALVRLGLDELEAMRLCDVDDHDQESAGRRMGVSRGTVQRLLTTGRAKVVRALLLSAALVIEGGNDATVHADAG
jgi:predicted DNA-binding protein (UPF0251 family)